MSEENFTLSGDPLPQKLCECGCGQPTKLARQDNKKSGVRKGRPQRFIDGHSRMSMGVTGFKACSKCGLIKPATVEFFHRKGKECGPNPWSNLQSICKECSNNRVRENYREQRQALYQKHGEAWKKTRAEKRAALKREMVAAYGGKCSCCGESEIDFLTLEHINRDGREHRRSLGVNAGGYVLYQDLKKRGWPQDGYTVQCYNCNCSAAHTGVCPHKRPKTS